MHFIKKLYNLIYTEITEQDSRPVQTAVDYLIGANWLANMGLILGILFGYGYSYNTSKWQFFGYSGLSIVLAIWAFLSVIGIINFILIYFCQKWKYRNKILFITLIILIFIKVLVMLILFIVGLIVIYAQTSEIWVNEWVRIEKIRFSKHELSAILTDELHARKIPSIPRETRLQILRQVKNPEALKALVEEACKHHKK